MPRVQRIFPADICAAVESALTVRPSGPNEVGVLDDDWAFVSCLASDDRSEIVVTLRAAGVPDGGSTQSDVTQYGDTHILIAADDLDVLNGRSLGMDMVDLALELFEVFSRQAAPDEVSGIIRLPSWDPVL
jgi:hypothetical protein